MAKKAIIFWIILLLIFSIVFALGYLNLKSGDSFLGIMPPEPENISLMVLSFAGIAKSVYEIIRIEIRR